MSSLEEEMMPEENSTASTPQPKTPTTPTNTDTSDAEDKKKYFKSYG
jgi:hypothetical protein